MFLPKEGHSGTGDNRAGDSPRNSDNSEKHRRDVDDFDFDITVRDLLAVERTSFIDDLRNGPTRRLSPVPPPTDDDGPLDINALRADDALLTALASHRPSSIGPGQDAELRDLLQSWRLDVDAEPITELVDVDTAAATIAVGARIHKRRPRYLVPLATAAAVLVVAFAGMGLAARNAQPGDALWGLSQVLYSDHARSVEAAASVRSDLHHASQALAQGEFNEARTALVQAQQSLPAVATSDGKANLQAQQQTLLDQLNNTSGLAASSTTSGVAPVSSTSVAPSATTTAPPPTSTVPPTTTTSPTTTTTPPTTTTDVTQSSGTQDAPGQPGQTSPAQAPVVNGPAGGSGTGTGTGTSAGTDAGTSSGSAATS